MSEQISDYYNCTTWLPVLLLGGRAKDQHLAIHPRRVEDVFRSSYDRVTRRDRGPVETLTKSLATLNLALIFSFRKRFVWWPIKTHPALDPREHNNVVRPLLF